MLLVKVLPYPSGPPTPTPTTLRATAAAGNLSAATRVSLNLTGATSVSELLRNACVNCGLFPIVASAGRIVNVAAFLELQLGGGTGSNTGSSGTWINADCTGDSDATVLGRLGVEDVLPTGTFLKLLIVHAATAATAAQLFRVFAEDNDVDHGDIDAGIALIRVGFEESGLFA